MTPVTFPHTEAEPVEMLPGLVRRTLADGEHVMIVEFTFEANVQVPLHTHPNEQAGYVVSGEMHLTVNGESRLYGPGDSYLIPAGVEHGAFSPSPAVVIDAFSPPRQDYRKSPA
jgi:quercetin dioxygenase-like cupin family protein